MAGITVTDNNHAPSMLVTCVHGSMPKPDRTVVPVALAVVMNIEHKSYVLLHVSNCIELDILRSDCPLRDGSSEISQETIVAKCLEESGSLLKPNDVSFICVRVVEGTVVVVAELKRDISLVTCLRTTRDNSHRLLRFH